MKYIHKNNRWYDENNNSWATKKDAKKYSPTLTHCYDCYDCSDCSDCSECRRCYNCSGCSDCVDCSRCSDCSDCSDCHGCSDCRRCSNYNNCSEYSEKSPKAKTQNDLSGKIIEIDGKKYKLIEAWYLSQNIISYSHEQQPKLAINRRKQSQNSPCNLYPWKPKIYSGTRVSWAQICLRYPNRN